MNITPLFVFLFFLSTCLCQVFYVNEDNHIEDEAYLSYFFEHLDLNIYLTVSSGDSSDLQGTYLDVDNVDENNENHNHFTFYFRNTNTLYSYEVTRRSNKYNVESSWISIRSNEGLNVGCDMDNFYNRGSNYSPINVNVNDVYLFYDVENESCFVLSTNPPINNSYTVDDVIDWYYGGQWESSFESTNTLFFCGVSVVVLLVTIITFTICVCWCCASDNKKKLEEEEEENTQSTPGGPKSIELKSIPVVVQTDNGTNNNSTPTNMIYYPVKNTEVNYPRVCLV
eukprot:TRINITY_DN129_c0_g1_i2.p1 TRINITY_DN129_c0_g1~~TRINITY_DN129_c0_g1_i2.p1  ORF type:complete len:283 (+),score=84.07 TRINITY_DN129_c0_g1_i2:72-920(+)